MRAHEEELGALQARGAGLGGAGRARHPWDPSRRCSHIGTPGTSIGGVPIWELTGPGHLWDPSRGYSHIGTPIEGVPIWEPTGHGHLWDPNRVNSYTGTHGTWAPQ